MKNTVNQPPETLNLVLLVISSCACSFFLWYVSHSSNFYFIGLSILGFALTANTIFSLLHEAVHGMFNKRYIINLWAGRFAACWFPTSLIIQREFHLTHHKNNRMPEEQFDVLHKNDIKWLKYAQWYSILTGLYWFISVLAIILYLVFPLIFNIKTLKNNRSQVALQTSSSAYFSALKKVNSTHARLEILTSLAFQFLLFWGLGLTLWGWLSCYAGFALFWSSLQYADHAYSELDTNKGAWNLSVSPVTRAFFLNYHYHLSHHQYPDIPWIHLGKFVNPAEFHPTFWKVWKAMWRGPRPLSELDKVIN